ncbi:hypothetical protein ACQKIE_09875 [Luteibacter sp. NPDC031894]|uniref:hypothetical protein n=1 Tax=Luteibacter sp. NPDC031894 TaxID=3390572 RepID=UPI003CFFE6CA
MKASEIKAMFPTEAALCDLFIEDMRAMGGWTIYPETAGFDILLVRDATGHQLGVEAKLALNAKVCDQILPGIHAWYGGEAQGPDFRAVIVPYVGDASEGIAKMLGILGVQVWAPERHVSSRPGMHFRVSRYRQDDGREFDSTCGELMEWDTAWFDWNPSVRCVLPEIVPHVRAGVPAPTQLTPWKIGALKVLADLEVFGFVTAKSVRGHSVDPRRFCAADGWLAPLGGGRWARGRMPRFEDQHPEAYAQILEATRARASQEVAA